MFNYVSTLRRLLADAATWRIWLLQVRAVSRDCSQTQAIYKISLYLKPVTHELKCRPVSETTRLDSIFADVRQSSIGIVPVQVPLRLTVTRNCCHFLISFLDQKTGPKRYQRCSCACFCWSCCYQSFDSLRLYRFSVDRDETFHTLMTILCIKLYPSGFP